MKAEINNENKAKFFAQYWNQELKTSPSHNNSLLKPFEINEYSIRFVNNDSYLELKSLSDISDEDAINVAKSLGLTDKNSDKFLISWGVNYVLENENSIISNISDFLRSCGYLVPWMGLSPEEIIEAGWAKYREV